MVEHIVNVVASIRKKSPSPAKPKWAGKVAGPSEQQERKRSAILETAARLFEERGYYETSLADIAAALHVTKPTLYYYVANKEDIVGQIIERATVEVEACGMRARAEGDNGLERLRVFVRSYFEMMNTDFGRCLLSLRRVPVSAAARTRSAAGYRRIDAVGRELIAEGVADGSIRDCNVRLAAFALYGAIIWTPNWFHAGESLNAAEAGDALFEIFAGGLSRTPTRKRPQTKGSKR